MILRKYQNEAVEAVWEALKRDEHCVVALPTGSGKSAVLATLAARVRDAGGIVWVLSHVAELIDQNYKTFCRIAGSEHTGIICAGLGEKTEGGLVTFATVQSIYKKAKARQLKEPDLILIDECHRISKKGGGKFYDSVFKAYPEAKRAGLSATPWRLSGGNVYGNSPDHYFDTLCYRKDILELILEGYLCPLVGVSTKIQLDMSGAKKTAGDFRIEDIEERSTIDWLRAVAKSVVELSEKRKSVLIFAPSVKTANNLADIFTEMQLTSCIVTGETDDRADVIDGWKTGKVRFLINVSVLTTGFDHPPTDCIVCLRPTESTSLWVQIMGRSTRLSEGKKNALILDYAGNLDRLGGVGCFEDFHEEGKDGEFKKRPAKPKEVVSRKVKKSTGISDADPMAGSTGSTILANVISCSYVVIKSKQHIGKSILMVKYSLETETGTYFEASNFICPEYSAYARQQAVKWFEGRGLTAEEVPRTANYAKIKCYGLPTPRQVRVRKQGKYINVVAELF